MAGGLLEPGNIDLNNRPRHVNEDGSISTVRSMSFNENGREILVPTIADNGQPLTEDEAIDLYHKTGRHLGMFSTPDDATRYAISLHNDQARLVANNPYDRMFPGTVPDQPPPELVPGAIPGLPPQYQNLAPGQMVPMPVGLPPDNPMAPPAPPEPIPGVPPQYQAPPNVPIPVQGLPPGQPIPGQAPAPVLAQSIPAPVHRAPQGPGLVQQFDTRINANQKAIEEASAEQQQAITEGSQKVGQAQLDKSVERRSQAVELADKQAEIQKHNQELDAIDAANLRQAKEATIPDFWAGREGARVGSTIAVALAGIGAGLLGSTSNTALNAIQHNIDQYFHREKERIDNLYKYAEAQGKLNAQTRMNYAQDLLNLKDQHSYVMASAADRVDAVATQAKGAADAAATKTLSTQLRAQAEKDKLNVRNINSEILLRKAQEAEAYGKASEAKARAAQGGYLTPAQTMQVMFKTGNELDKAFKPVTQPKGLNEEANHLIQNIKMANQQPNNPAPFVGLLDSLITAYSGGKVTQGQYQTWLKHIAPGADSLEQVKEGFLTGRASETQRKNLLDVAIGKLNGIREELKGHHENFRTIKNGPEFQGNPVLQNMLNRKELEIFGHSPGFGGKEPDLGNGPGITRVQLKDGTIAEFDATGKRVK